MKENKFCCNNCAMLEKINTPPVYAICRKENIVFELWKKDARNYICKEFKTKKDGE